VRLFVTGGSGFIGGALVRRLRLEGHEVKVLARSPRAEALALEAGAIPISGDIAHQGPWQNEVSSSDVVVHAAAMVGDWGPRKEFIRVNVGGTRNILNAVQNWGGHFVHISSIAVHGFRSGTYTEVSPAAPGRHPYSSSKAAAEGLVGMSVGKGLKASVVRIAGVYGPGDPHLISRLLDYAGSGRVFIVGRGDQPSNLIYIDDVIEGLLAILRRDGEPGARYVLNDPAVPDVLSMMRLAMKGLELAVPVQSVPEWFAHAVALWQEARARLMGSPPSLTRYAVRAMGHRCVFSSEGTSRKLGWSPRMSVGEGVERTISWHRKTCPSSPADAGSRIQNP
jgi:nucleoside-diphosphate-sugar epimerase